jgi:two-component system chemotaxis sensor kinase CheA
LPDAADAALLKALDCVLAGEKLVQATLAAEVEPAPAHESGGPDWTALYHTITGTPAESVAAPQEVALPMEIAPVIHAAAQVDLAPRAKAPSAQQPAAKETTIRVDTSRLDMVLNLSGEIGLTKNRLTCLRANILQGKTDGDTLKALDEAVSHLDLLVGDLQNAVMKTRMQPIGRLFQKYPRLARDLARQLGKDVELLIVGEETEIDKTMIEDLNDPIVHLVRNAVDHGVESTQERIAAGKPSKSLVKLSAMQSGDHIVIEIADDGKGMRPDTIRRKAVDKGLIDTEAANTLDDKQSLNLIFLPGFSTKDEISDVSGRGVGMDVVRTNIQKLNGRIDINSVVGHGTTITISLPLTLAILPVLVVRLGEQPFAVPLSMVREIIPIHPEEIQRVSGRATMVVRDEVLPVRSLASLIGWPQDGMPSFGVLMQATATNFILAIDGFLGRDDVVIKPLHDIKPKGIAGATLSGDGLVVLVLDIEELLEMSTEATHASMFTA